MKTVFFIPIVLLAFVVQTTAFDFFPWLTVYPDIILVMAMYGGLKWGKIKGLQFGAALGFFQDLLLYGTMGTNLFSKAVTGFVTGSLRESYIEDSMITRITLVAFATVFDLLAFDILTQVVLGDTFRPVSLSVLMRHCVINVAMAMVIYPLVMRLEKHIDEFIGKGGEGGPTISGANTRKH